jgi:four helix bundle protein
MMKRFRFEDMEIWKLGTAIAVQLFAVAVRLEERNHVRCAEALRAAALKVTNNIAEGSGSGTDEEFAGFLDIAKRASFEAANMVLFYREAGFIDAAMAEPIVTSIEDECRMLEAYRLSLLR